MHCILKQKRLRWLGHLCRMEDGRIPKDLLFGELATGTRPLGRPSLRFKDICKQDLKDCRIEPADLSNSHLKPHKLENHLQTRQSTGRRKEDEPAKEKERRKEAEIQFSTRKQSSLLMHPLRQSLPLTHRALQPQQALQELIPWACLSLSVKTEDVDDESM